MRNVALRIQYDGTDFVGSQWQNQGRSVQAGTVDLDLVALGIDPTREFQVHDLLTDRTFTWSGWRCYVELHPDIQPGHIFRVSQG